MNSEKYIGLDVHQATIVFAVLDSSGRLVMESILETEAATILQFFAGLRPKGQDSARPHLNRRATPRLHPVCAVCSPDPGMSVIEIFRQLSFVQSNLFKIDRSFTPSGTTLVPISSNLRSSHGNRKNSPTNRRRPSES